MNFPSIMTVDVEVCVGVLGEDDPSEEDELHSVEDGDGVNGVKEEGLSSIEVRVVPEDLTKCRWTWCKYGMYLFVYVTIVIVKTYNILCFHIHFK